ncbi:hypothetical protein DID88_003288 [Monilinia fructigena]|uniref:Response regulatory domain-containing protein n=1 Tax=Monilinia fructigena TaxID=38457 RepID=A0A395IUW6_9HELO|nr:hypothetical protein DID88_003288 [Monilinia fructigena]
MPNVDGLQSTRLIREMGYSAPIVALTAFAEESNVKECYESGMDHFLSKPIRRPALKQVLKKFATIPERDGRLIPHPQKHSRKKGKPRNKITYNLHRYLHLQNTPSSDSNPNLSKFSGTPSPPSPLTTT